MSHNKRKIKAVLADDHAMVRAGIRQFLEHSGEIEVLFEAGHGDAVLQFLSDLSLSDPSPQTMVDIVVLDIKMPQRNGIETAQIIRANYPEIGVLILSAFDDAPYVRAVLDAGAHGFMLKSATPTQLVTAVHEIVDGRTILSPAIATKLVGMMTTPRRIPPDPLTNREMDVLVLLKDGKTNKEIGDTLNISSRTAQTHLTNVYRKLNVSNRTEALSYATKAGLFLENA